MKRLLVFQQSQLIRFLLYSNLLYLNITSRDSTNVTIYTLSPINQAKSDLHDRVFLLNYNWTRVFDKVRPPPERCRVLFTQEMTSHNTVKYCLQKKLRHSTQQSIVYRMNDVTVRSRVLFTHEMTSRYTAGGCLHMKWRHSTQPTVVYTGNDVIVHRCGSSPPAFPPPLSCWWWIGPRGRRGRPPQTLAPWRRYPGSRTNL